MRWFRILALTGLAFILCVFLASCGGGGSKPTPPAQLTVTSSTLTQGAVNSAYQTFLSASGGTTPYTWAITAGSLPPGLSLQGTSSQITGTPTTAGTYTFTAQVTDAKNLTATATQTIVIEGLILIDCNSCATGTTTLPSGTPGVAYSAMLSASGGIGTYSWTAISGTLPGGLSLSTDSNGNAIISGTPINPGPPASVTLQASDTETPPASGTITVSVTIIQIGTKSLNNATINSSYSAAVTALGGQPNYSWCIVETSGSCDSGVGTLPPGLSISNSSCQNSKTPTCTISGTPTQLGLFSFTMRVSDGGTPPATATEALSIDVQGPKLTITTTSLPNGTVGQAYSATMQASGGIPPLTWCVIETGGTCDNGAGALPAGLTMSSAGVISGTPTGPSGKTSFQVQVQDSENPPQIVQSPPQGAVGELSITINPALSDANLSGNYAFSFNGYNNGSPVLMAGAFNADGNGTLTNGQLDVNDGSGETIDSHGNVVPQTLTTGSVYSITSNGTGSLTLVTSQGTYQFSLAISGPGCTVTTSASLCGKLIQSDSSNPQSYGSGILRVQNPAYFTTTGFFPGAFSMHIDGYDSQSNRFAAAGAFEMSSSNRLALDCTTSGWGLPNGCPGDSNDAGTAASLTFLGNFDGTVDQNTGRGGFVNLTFNGDSGDVYTYAFYILNANEMILISADPIAKPANLTLWSIFRQSSSAGGWSTVSLKGPAALELQGIAPNGGTPVADATLGLLNADGNGNATLSSDQNLGGTMSQQSSQGTYTVNAKTGRVVLSGFDAQFGSTPPVIYLFGPNAGYVVGTDTAVSSGVVEAQAIATYSNSSINGNYAGGSMWPATASVTDSVATLFANGAGTLSGTQYTSGPNGPSGPNAVSLTYQVDATGRTVVQQGGNAYGIAYVVSTGKIVLLPADSNPTLNVFSTGSGTGITH